MKNVELRWLSNTVKTCGVENCKEQGCYGEIKTLQYRQVIKVEKNYISGGWKKCTFSDWEDVPVVTDK